MNQIFIDDADIYNRVGGQAALTQLLDPDGMGTWNTDVSLLARADACNMVLEAAGVASDLGGYTPVEFRARFPNLVTYAALKSIALAWVYGTGGQALPERIKTYDDKADAALDLLAKRKRKHGASDFSPTPSQEVRGDIELGSPDCRMTLASWKTSFC